MSHTTRTRSPGSRLRSRAIALVAVGAAALTACGSSQDALGTGASSGAAASGDTVVVGSANFPENELIAEIYAGALTSIGVTVEKKLNFGSRELYLSAIQSGEITVLPDYTGNLLLQYDKAATAASSEEVYTALQAALPEDLNVLQYSPAEDKDALAVLPATAQKYGLKSIADLTPVCGELTIGGSPSLVTRQAGLVGLKDKYSCTFGAFKTTDTGGPISVSALKDGTIDVADLYTTDPNIPDNGFVLLDDPKNVFPAQNVVPLFKAGALSQPAQDKLDEVSKKLNTADLTSLLREVYSPMPAETVAKQWLTDNQLI